MKIAKQTKKAINDTKKEYSFETPKYSQKTSITIATAIASDSILKKSLKKSEKNSFIICKATSVKPLKQ